MSDQEDTLPGVPAPDPGAMTATLETPDPVLVALLRLTQSVDRMGADVKLVSNDLGIVKDRLVIVENWKGEQDLRSSRTSAGVRSLSTTDAEQQAQLAQERAAREALAGKVDDLTKSQEMQLAILSRLDKVASNPTVKVVLFAVGTVVTGWLTSKGLSK